MDKYKVFLYRFEAWVDITDYVGDLQSVDELNTLSVEVSFSLFQNSHDRYNIKLNLSCGDKIQIQNNGKEVFSGVITSDSIDFKYTANDVGWYLNESELVIQFNSVPADRAVSMLCTKAGIPLGEVPSMSTIITAVYLGDTFASIFEDILEQVSTETGRTFLYRIEGGKLWLKDMPSDVLTLKHKPFDNVQSFDPTWALGQVSGSRSLSNLRNSIVLAKEENDTAYILATAENSESIATFGKLQKVLTVDDSMSGSTASIVQTALAQYNKLSGEYSVTMYGDDQVKSGRCVRFSSGAFGLAGIYRVQSVTHYYAVPHLMDLVVTPVEINEEKLTNSGGAVYQGDKSSNEIDVIISEITQLDRGASGASAGTGGTAGRFLSVAAGETGTTESPIGSNKQKYGTWFGMNGVAWCAIFVSWCANQAGVTSVVPDSFASVSQFQSWYANKGWYRSKDSYTPKAGDIMIQKSAGASHIGIVESVNSSGFTAIEGNSSNRVQRVTYSFSNSKISGYGVPDWS